MTQIVETLSALFLLGVLKWAELGIEYPLDGTLPPTEEEIEEAEKIFR